MNNTTYINRRSAVKIIGTIGITSTFVSANAFGQNRKADGFALVGASTPFEVVKTALDENIVTGLDLTLDYAADPEQQSYGPSRHRLPPGAYREFR